ncbi:molybdenum cofactor biosynthesis protein MoaE [Campylobacter fetus]|uniref:molybdopterin synthase catalytic subunit n=1 Tax=Campylobacter fetus TaxID=196 RepID=UPI000508E6E0|nr:molybdenum cofactor biosynthesis protein MoaE [Campylobacter fetus]WKW17548.1 molybdenum cofactor biosynthesis protein MoaE [Campylobacter fetus subsp. fetus]AIR78146.1 molybdopterin synthase, large subunit [Campylobacter fetus subsp. fetus 04/554]EAJ5693264.1 molybdenum cofactor biosynthesis protein MoaE [Campylobacter fetus]EAJ5703902.1 molybdenum cofactor biosynthesis protein MoaE [Campylobacter fetus]EAJ9256619.1 molybdenum cofactor biosynthesis protein MoaE [Campylobacter fetus]
MNSDIELFSGSLNVTEITNRWYDNSKNLNYGAIITFVGVVRDEDGIDGLSFDIYEPLLKKWFDMWQKKAKEKNTTIFMAHSKGDVPNHTSSFIAGVLSPKRKAALTIINEFVEDFKANAPIWKYDLKNKQRIYAKDRSQKLAGAGILS